MKKDKKSMFDKEVKEQELASDSENSQTSSDNEEVKGSSLLIKKKDLEEKLKEDDVLRFIDSFRKMN